MTSFSNIVYRNTKLKKPSKIEAALWTYINQSKTGYQFNHQYSIYGLRVDFSCRDLKLGIELEGGYHDLTKDYELKRGKIINEFGWTFLQFSKEQITRDIKTVVKHITLQCNVASLPLKLFPLIHSDKCLYGRQKHSN